MSECVKLLVFSPGSVWRLLNTDPIRLAVSNVELYR